MPYAATHILIVIVLLELFRDYFVKNKKAFPLHYILIGGLAGLLPDLDIAVFYVLSFFGFTMQEVHRTFSHTLFFPLLFVLLALPFWKFKSKELGEHHLKLRNIFLVIAFGIFMHLALDYLVVGMIIPFYPFSTYSLGLNLVSLAPLSWRETILGSLDALVLVLWLAHLEIKHKISNFL